MSFKPHHVGITVKNTEESVKWYEQKLGFVVTHRYNKNGMEITQMKREHVWLELFSFGDTTNPLPEYRKNLMDDLHVIGTKHLAIEVDDLEKMIEELRIKGVEFRGEIDTAGFGGRYIFFKDCNGILIELYQADSN